jgi:hypothetical protein
MPFQKRGTEYVGESGVEWMNGDTKRRCDRALSVPSRGSLQLQWAGSGRRKLVACSRAPPLLVSDGQQPHFGAARAQHLPPGVRMAKGVRGVKTMVKSVGGRRFALL